MKKEIVLKVLKRYYKGLETMCNESISNNEMKDAEHYRFDMQAINEAINCVERSNT